MRKASTIVTPCGRVLLSMRLPCGCCSADVMLDIIEAHQLAASLYADIVIASTILARGAASQAWIFPEVQA